MAQLRIAALKQPQLVGKWGESVEPVKALIQNRFLRLKLKEEQVAVIDPASHEEIDVLKRHLRELFPDLNLEKLQKVYTNKCQSYMSWKLRHCVETQYTFQIRKCADEQCCLPPTCDRESLSWLLNPMLDESGDHYKPYDLIINEETSECDRPSSKLSKPPRPTRRTDVTVPHQQADEITLENAGARQEDQTTDGAFDPQHGLQTAVPDTNDTVNLQPFRPH